MGTDMMRMMRVEMMQGKFQGHPECALKDIQESDEEMRCNRVVQDDK